MNIPEFPEHQFPRGIPTYLGEFFGVHVWMDGDPTSPFMCVGRGLHNNIGSGVWLDTEPTRDLDIIKECCPECLNDPEIYAFLAHFNSIRQLL